MDRAEVGTGVSSVILTELDCWESGLVIVDDGNGVGTGVLSVILTD